MILDSINRHSEICAKLRNIYAEKNSRYGDSFSKVFKDLGIMSAVTQITHKNNRLISLVKNPQLQVPDESVLDTLYDLANYCIMTIMEIEDACD